MGVPRIFIAALIFYIVSFYANAARTEEDHRWVLEQLRQRFYDFRLNVQFAVLYVPPPNAPRRQMIYLPSPNWNRIENRILYPEVDNRNNPYEHNFATASPDTNGVEYGAMMGGRDQTIHTEDLVLNLVMPGLQEWYEGQFNRQPWVIYLFTHFLPCDNCFAIIRDFQANFPDTPVVVGYTNLFMGREATIPERRAETERRRDTLNEFLGNYGGRLLQLATFARGVCGQRGLWRRHGKRDVSVLETCPANTKNKEFIITMEFSTGKAAVNFAGIAPDQNGWIGLYDNSGSQITYEWTYGSSVGYLVFNSYIKERPMEVRYFRKNSRNPLVVSLQWDKCGFDYITLTALPNSYGDVQMKLSVNNGYPKIYVSVDHYEQVNSYDWVAIQTMDQVGTNDYWTWQWVSSMTEINNSAERARYYWSSSALNSETRKGFRAKYIRYDPIFRRYDWGDDYENVTPLWTPEGCSGTNYTYYQI